MSEEVKKYFELYPEIEKYLTPVIAGVENAWLQYKKACIESQFFCPPEILIQYFADQVTLAKCELITLWEVIFIFNKIKQINIYERKIDLPDDTEEKFKKLIDNLVQAKLPIGYVAWLWMASYPKFNISSDSNASVLFSTIKLKYCNHVEMPSFVSKLIAETF